ncbi:MAG: alpha/beta hydrolase [Proteobacteria bacterium]|nr:alpha/beta hydrolase [Pseudomonadota bacterium]
MSKEQLYAILEMGAQNPPPVMEGPVAMRGWFEAMMEPTPVAEGIAITPVTIAGHGCEFVRPAGAPHGKLIVYFHGGGFIFGSPRSHRVIASNLARASGITVLSAQYRMAPENPYPAAHDDAFAVYQWVLEQGHAAGSVALCGDSAGGNLALGTAVRARDAGLPLPAALVLLSPALDFAHDGASHTEMADAPLVNRPFAEMFTAMYLGDGDRRDPGVAPLQGDLSGLPPTQVQVGSWEFLRDDSVTLVQRLKAAGGEAELTLWEGMCHNHQLFAPLLEEGMASIDRAGAFLRGHLRT